MGDTLKLLEEGELIEWLDGPDAGSRARIIIRERRYFAVLVDGKVEAPVDLEHEGRFWKRVGSRGRR